MGGRNAKRFSGGRAEARVRERERGRRFWRLSDRPPTSHVHPITCSTAVGRPAS